LWENAHKVSLLTVGGLPSLRRSQNQRQLQVGAKHRRVEPASRFGTTSRRGAAWSRVGSPCAGARCTSMIAATRARRPKRSSHVLEPDVER